MRKLKVIFLLIFLFSPKIFAQLYEHTFEFDKKSKSFDTKTNYFEVNHRLIFEYGLLFCITREESLASTLTAGYEFNIISKKLYGGVQIGAGYVHDENGGGPLATIGLGFDYRAITEGKYSFSVYAGAQGMAVLGAAAVFGVIHVRNTWMISDNLAFSVGLKYLPQFLL